MNRIVERCCGLDVHKSSVTACVRVAKKGVLHQETKEFAATTQGLLVLRDWLVSFEVQLVCMEATGVYWKPIYYMLEDDFELWLLNAEHLKHVPGRKTDAKDAEWICQLVEHGLVRPSFVPPKEIRELKEPYPLPQGADRGTHQGSPTPREGPAGGWDKALFGCHSR